MYTLVTTTVLPEMCIRDRSTAPVVGATKLQHIESAVKAIDLVLKDSEIEYLEQPYVPHKLVGVMAQNTHADSVYR